MGVSAKEAEQKLTPKTVCKSTQECCGCCKWCTEDVDMELEGLYCYVDGDKVSKNMVCKVFTPESW